VDLKAGMIRFYRLRRREPGDQPLIREVTHRIKNKLFHE
jgi:two-component sensor histidine kinase